MEDCLKLIEGLLREKGLKLTYQRKVILEEIYKQNAHLRAEDIYDKIRNKNIGLATVYRNLNLLADLDIIREIKVSGVNFYESKLYSDREFHIHFKVEETKEIIDIDDPEIMEEIQKFKKHLEEKHNLITEKIDMLLTGKRKI